MRKQVEILKVPIDDVSNVEAMERLKIFLEEPNLKKVYTPNPEIVMLAQDDPELLRIIQEADLVLADGIGLFRTELMYLDKPDTPYRKIGGEFKESTWAKAIFMADVVEKIEKVEEDTSTSPPINKLRKPAKRWGR